ncbi:MAG: YdbL family protein [Planctomycetes bacterium]|jgi:uncharacterized protein YdbL (DUF1318 family)|nr:YdbL family protein [Planctomycetota bacterium]
MRTAIVMALALVALTATALSGPEEDLGKLKERFIKRHPVLSRLANEGKVGEVHDGYAAAVKTEYLDQKAGPDADSPTIRAFLAEENGDRSRLYAILAEKEALTPEIVADRAGKRNFDRAKPDHWLKPKDGAWVQKKDLG